MWSLLVSIAVAAAGTWVFCKGFMVIRKKTTAKSTAHPPVEHLWDWSGLAGGGWLPTPRPNPKLIFVLIDALRFDFAATSQESSPREPYEGQLTLPQELHAARRGTLFQFISDPPTATGQRLKALMCGSLPTFVEASANFSESGAQQDSIVHQMLARSRRLSVVGDDTWLYLFPEVKTQAQGVVEGYWSFGLFDLHTVDDAIKAAFQRIDWSMPFTVAHFLGLDHCGHKHGPQHPNCAAKLAEMDAVLRGLPADEDTILVVAGDHGMTDTGDHGGASPREVTAAMFSSVHNGLSPDFLRRVNDARLGDLRASMGDFARAEYPAVTQIDLVPTLALSLGLPIPFASLGNLIPEMLPLPAEHGAKYLVEAVRLTSHQLLRSLQHYGRLDPARDFDAEDVAPFVAELRSVDGRVLGMDEEDAFMAYFELNLRMLRHCRRVWSPSSSGLMYAGLALLSAAVLGLFALQPHVLVAGVHAAGLLSTSFVIFEEWTVRFLLALISTAASGDAAQTLVALAVNRAASYFGACREEQFPFCSAVGHRDLSAAGVAALAAAGLAFLGRSRRGKPGNALFFAGAAACMASWAWRWTEELHLGRPVDWRVAAALGQGVPLLVYATAACWLLFGSSVDALLVLGAFLQRPVGGFLMLCLGTWQLDFAARLPASLVAPYHVLLGMHWGFLAGHQTTITHVQWESAFIGLSGETWQALPAVLLFINSAAGPLVAAFHLARRHRPHTKAYLLHHAALLLACAAACTVLFRHLMIWKIFAPRLTIQVVSSGAAAVAVALGHLQRCE